MDEREEWDDELRRSNEEVTCRVEDQEREEEMMMMMGREERENKGIWSLVRVYRYTYDIQM